MLKAVLGNRVPACDTQGRIDEPFGMDALSHIVWASNASIRADCKGFHYIRGFLSQIDQDALVSVIGDTPAAYAMLARTTLSYQRFRVATWLVSPR